MPIAAFRLLAKLLRRVESNAEAFVLLRRYAVRAFAWLFLTELALLAGDYPVSLLCNVLISTRKNFVFGSCTPSYDSSVSRHNLCFKTRQNR